jgi:hypothetical protein
VPRSDLLEDDTESWFAIALQQATSAQMLKFIAVAKITADELRSFRLLEHGALWAILLRLSFRTEESDDAFASTLAVAIDKLNAIADLMGGDLASAVDKPVQLLECAFSSGRDAACRAVLSFVERRFPALTAADLTRIAFGSAWRSRASSTSPST